MKKINVISESSLFQDRHFIVVEYYGKKIVAFHVTEHEFVNKSLYLTAYGTDCKPLPTYFANAFSDSAFRKIKNIYCGTDFYIISDKGSIGFDSMICISKVHVDETDDEFIIKISLETDEDVKNRLLVAYSKYDMNIASLFNERFFGQINEYAAPVPELVKKARETPFLDIDGGTLIQLNVDNTGTYQFTNDMKGYHAMDGYGTIEVGTYLYTNNLKNSVEIATIQQIAHSVYGYFYAVVEPVYVYPRDAETIKQKFPEFYKEHCMTEVEQRVKDFIGNPEVVSFISEENTLGNSVIYQPLNIGNDCYGISDSMFQFTLANAGGFGDYTQINSAFVRVERDAVVGTLIRVDGCFKIILYKCDNVVKNENTFYAKFKYEDESDFFNDFSSAGKSIFKKQHHRNVCRNVEYLLCKQAIEPVIISRAEYDCFVKNS